MFGDFDVSRRCRGSAAVAMILVLVILQIVVVAVVLAGGRDQDLTLKRLDSIRGFYAAEGGMNMAIREMRTSTDEDGDGGIGTISNDGNSANNPTISMVLSMLAIAPAKANK